MARDKEEIEIDTRLGRRRIDTDKVIRFPHGLAGFEGRAGFHPAPDQARSAAAHPAKRDRAAGGPAGGRSLQLSAILPGHGGGCGTAAAPDQAHGGRGHSGHGFHPGRRTGKGGTQSHRAHRHQSQCPHRPSGAPEQRRAGQINMHSAWPMESARASPEDEKVPGPDSSTAPGA